MFTCFCTIIFLSVDLPTVLSTTVSRERGGDIFDATCNSCHLYNAFCADGGIHIFDCCTKCQCEFGATIYNDMCHDNLPQDELGCEIFLEKDEFFGLKTRGISKERVTHLGYIKSKWNWNRLVFDKCIIDDDSSYWDTKKWTNLFTNGRSISDFRIENGHNGVLIQAPWHINDRWQLYAGLLIKLSITCYSDHHIPHYGIDFSDITYSLKENGHHSLKSCLVTKFSGRRTYYEGTIASPIPVSMKPTSKVSTTKMFTANLTTQKLITKEQPTVKRHSVPGSITLNVCESARNNVMVLKCNGNQTIHIVSAFYGRQSTSICPGTEIGTINCRALKSQGLVKSICNGKQQCSLKAANSVFGDPCFGTTKYLQLTYICDPNDYGHVFTTPVSSSAKQKSAKQSTESFALSTQTTVMPMIVIKGITYDELCRVAVPVACVIAFVVLFICCIYCRWRRYFGLKNKEEFVISYGSTDSESLLNSNEYAVISSPTYADIWELENWEKSRKQDDGQKITKSTWKDECNPQTFVAQDTEEPRHISYASESSWDGTIYINGSSA